MKFPQIFMLLALFGMFIFSCRETNPGKGGIQEQQNNIPSPEKQKLEESFPKKPLDKPNRIFHDSLLKKQKKSKGLDTLRPKMAMLE